MVGLANRVPRKPIASRIPLRCSWHWRQLAVRVHYTRLASMCPGRGLHSGIRLDTPMALSNKRPRRSGRSHWLTDRGNPSVLILLSTHIQASHDRRSLSSNRPKRLTSLLKYFFRAASKSGGSGERDLRTRLMGSKRANKRDRLSNPRRVFISLRQKKERCSAGHRTWTAVL